MINYNNIQYEKNGFIYFKDKLYIIRGGVN